MTRQRVWAIVAGLLVTILLWVAALSNGLGSSGAAAAAVPAMRSTPAAINAPTALAPTQQEKNTGKARPQIAIPQNSISGPGTSYPAASAGSTFPSETETVVGFGDGVGGDD